MHQPTAFVDVAPERAISRRGAKARTAGVGAMVTAWTFFDGFIIGGPILLVAEGVSPLAGFLFGAAVWSLANLTVCRWLNRQWESGVAGSRFEARLHKVR